MTEFTPDETDILKRLAKFSAEEIETLKVVIKYWSGIYTVSRGLSGLGRFGQFVIYFYALYVAIKFGLLEQLLVGHLEVPK